MKNKTYITYEQYNNRINKYNRAIEQGLKPIIKKNWVKVGCGLVCLGIAIFPNGLGIAFYPLGFYFLGIGLKDIIEYRRIVKNKLRGLKPSLVYERGFKI